MKTKGIYFFLLLFILNSCGKSEKPIDTTTSGTIYIAADESIRPIVEAEEMVFESIYPDAHIDFLYVSEQDAVKLLLSDTVKTAILTRHLTDSEKKHFDETKIVPRYSPFANDAIAIILNNTSIDTVFTLEQISNILCGNLNSNTETNKNSVSKVVFDNETSGAIRYLKDSLLRGKQLSKNCFAVNTNQAVIDYVEKDKSAMGIIGMAWISDRDDTLSHGFLKRIKVAELIPKDIAEPFVPSMKPYQAYVALKQYPLWRKIEFLNCSGRSGLGTGFASFVASDRGQRIILKAGLVPATAPIRIVKLSN